MPVCRPKQGPEGYVRVRFRVLWRCLSPGCDADDTIATAGAALHLHAALESRYMAASSKDRVQRFSG